MNTEQLRSLERSAYRRSFSDGIVDLFVGLALLLMGAVWIWLPEVAGLAGIVPAVFVPVAIAIHKQYVEKRLGYVQWSQPRRDHLRRDLVITFGAGVVLLLAGVVAMSVATPAGESVLTTVAPAIMAWLLAFLALGLAVLTESWRFLVYGVVLMAGGLTAALLDAEPGWPLLVAGALATAVGLAMLAAFTKRYPNPENA